jgi:hypothetical protein
MFIVRLNKIRDMQNKYYSNNSCKSLIKKKI